MRALLAFLFLPLGLWAQQAATIRFQVDGPLDERMRICSVNTLLADTIWTEVDLAKTNEVSLQLWPITPIIITYKDKTARFRMCGGCSATVHFESEFLTETFQVTQGPEALFLAKLDSTFGNRNMMLWLMEQTAAASNLDGLEMDLFRLRKQSLDLLKQSDASEGFKTYFGKHVKAYYYCGLFAFAAQRSYRDKLAKVSSVPRTMADEVTFDMLSDRASLIDRFQTALLVEFVRHKALEKEDFYRFKTAGDEVEAALAVAKERLTDPVVYQHFAKHYALLHYATLPGSELRRLIAQSGDEAKDLELRLTKLVGPRLSDPALANSLPAASAGVESSGPNIEFTDTKGNTFKLSDLKGKVVYLDIWASWCGPCRKEFPYSKELMGKFSKKDQKHIEFLFISIDEKEDAWKKALDQMGLGGKHGRSEGGWQSPVCKDFGVTSIPRYVIIGRDGVVLDPNTLRPSDPALLDLLRQLIAR